MEKNENENLIINDHQILLSPSSPLICSPSKIIEQESIEELLSPNNNLINSGLIQQLSFLPKERDLYEVIHCLCNLQIDNGFMIQVRITFFYIDTNEDIYQYSISF